MVGNTADNANHNPGGVVAKLSCCRVSVVTKSRRARNLCLDDLIHLFKLRWDGLDFFRKPTVAAIEMAAAAGGLLAVAVEESPVGGEPILLPEGVLFQDGLAQRLGVGRKFG